MKKIFIISSVLAFFAGTIMVAGGLWGIMFTYNNVVRENITTAEGSAIPGVLVRGPLTLKAQADIIRVHVLKATGGKTYAEMPQQIPKLDENKNPLFDKDGKALTVPNDARNLWVTATTLTTALNLGIVTYAFSGLIFLFGLISIWNSVVFYLLSKKN